MQTVALKPKRAEWTALLVGLAILCGVMFAVPALCVPLALVTPLLACPLIGRREEPVAWAGAAVPVLASLMAGYDPLYAISLLLIGLIPLLITRLIPLAKRPGAAGMLMYVSAVAFSLVLVLSMAVNMLGGPLQVTLPRMIIQRMSRMDNLSDLLRQLAIQGLVSVPDGYTTEGVIRPLMQASYNQQMLMSLRLTLEMIVEQYLPKLFVNACVLVGLFTALRLERMNGVLLVVEAKTPSQKQTRVVAAPSFRLLAMPRPLRMLMLAMAIASFVLIPSGAALAQTVGRLCYAVFETLFTLLGAAVLVFLYTKNDPDRRIVAGILAAAMYVVAPFVLLLVGMFDQTFHFRNPQAHKPE